ncbi:MAG TPA: dTMP kinase [Pyrinomonadaceae bacterium]|nr:dTMP kinase [Pyrinomonadaceae bacterium]
MRGKFITFEGIDGSGKSTQARLLAGELRLKGYNVLATMEPGGTPLGRRLREAFLETEETVAPLAELLLFAADRAQHVELLVKPALAEGKIVVSDRFADATVAYQGAGRGFPEKTVSRIVDMATGGLKPDLTLFFDLPIEKAILRAKSRDASGEAIRNRMDSETADFYRRVRDAYLKIAEKESKRFRVVKASGSVEETRAMVLEIAMNFLKK